MQSVSEQTAALAALLETRLGVRGKGLEAKLRRAGRALPRWLRRDAQALVDAESRMAHPKLAMQNDPAALERAFKNCETYLKAIDPNARHKERWLGILATNAFNLLLIAALVVVTLRLAGLV